jgi:hypothetical protein
MSLMNRSRHSRKHGNALWMLLRIQKPGLPGNWDADGVKQETDWNALLEDERTTWETPLNNESIRSYDIRIHVQAMLRFLLCKPCVLRNGLLASGISAPVFWLRQKCRNIQSRFPSRRDSHLQHHSERNFSLRSLSLVQQKIVWSSYRLKIISAYPLVYVNGNWRIIFYIFQRIIGDASSNLRTLQKQGKIVNKFSVIFLHIVIDSYDAYG